MSVYRVGKYYHYSFQFGGVPYHASTRLAATPHNLTRAREIEFKAKQLAREGNAHLLRLQPMPFSSAAEQFIAWYEGEHRDKPNTIKGVRTACTSLKLFFKQKPIHLITDGDVEDFKTWRREIHQVREVTIRHNLHALGPLFRFAMKHRWCTNNPVERVDIPSDADSNVMHVLTPAEEKLYFDAAESISQDLYDLGRLMLLQGPRPWCEVAQTRVEHVDLESGTWFILKTKSNAGRRVLYLTPEAKSILARRVASHCNGILFPSRTKRAPRNHMSRAHENALKASGLHFRIYDLRHTFATRLGEKGADAFVIAKILGHNDLRTVLKYVHLSDARAREVMQKFGQQPEEFRPEVVN